MRPDVVEAVRAFYRSPARRTDIEKRIRYIRPSPPTAWSIPTDSRPLCGIRRFAAATGSV